VSPKKDAIVKLQEKLDRLQERYEHRGRLLDAATEKLEHVESQLRAEREAERERARRRSSGATANYFRNGHG
jgi:chromosome segregation ATPase